MLPTKETFGLPNLNVQIPNFSSVLDNPNNQPSEFEFQQFNQQVSFTKRASPKAVAPPPPKPAKDEKIKVEGEDSLNDEKKKKETAKSGEEEEDQQHIPNIKAEYKNASYNDLMEYHQSQYREQEKIRQLNRMRHHMPTKIYENEYYMDN